MINIDEFIQISNQLAPLPASSSRLASLIADPNANTNDIVNVISLDPALTVNLLKTANSAASNPANEITTVKDAIVRLGLGTVLSLAIGKDVKGQMQSSAKRNSNESRLWNHSVAAALAAEQIKSFTKDPIPPETFTAALLHDIGKLLMSRYLKPEIQDKVNEAVSSGSSIDQVEFDFFDCDHAELGGIVARQWELPESIIHGISWHHSPHDFIPDMEGSKIIPYVVCLADGVAKSIGAGIGEDDTPLEDNIEAQKYLGISDEDYKKICEQTKKKFNDIGLEYN